MANDFKRICTPSVSNSSNSTIYAVPNNSGAAVESIVIGITAANKTSSGVTLDIFIDNKGKLTWLMILKDIVYLM